MSQESCACAWLQPDYNNLSHLLLDPFSKPPHPDSLNFVKRLNRQAGSAGASLHSLRHGHGSHLVARPFRRASGRP